MPRKIEKLSDVFDARKTKESYNLKPHPQTGRLIDSHPGGRTRTMRVLVLGMSRTGTMTILAALEQLGLPVYHMAKAIMSPNSNLRPWMEGLQAKFYGQGEEFGREEFDKILGNYEAVCDVPCVTFWKELIKAYPDAKVVLNTRNVDRWLASMDATAGETLRWGWWPLLARWDPALVRPFWEFANTVMPTTYHTLHDFSPSSPAREVFLKHYEDVRNACPPTRLLEYKVQDGWEPLCKFLEVPVPEEEFPHVNDKDQFLVAHKIMWYLGFAKMVGKNLAVAVPIMAVGAAFWYQRGASTF